MPWCSHTSSTTPPGPRCFGAHAAFAERAARPGADLSPSRAARYPSEVSPFAALADPADPESWADLRRLVGEGGIAALGGVLTPPDGWETVGSVPGVQLVDTSPRAEPAPAAVRLGPRDVPEILALIELTEPGPFLPRTVELGTDLGIRHRGRLIAMAGERLRPPGWTEISAVCTHPDHRGGGLATPLVRAVAAGIRERGDVPFGPCARQHRCQLLLIFRSLYATATGRSVSKRYR